VSEGTGTYLDTRGARKRIAELLATRSGSGSTADRAIADAARAWVKDPGACHFCDYGSDPGDGTEKGHDDDCPIELHDNGGGT
jgi:hypothetical protein